MSFVGNSRPASGSEHHLTHFWEMMFLFRGKKAVLHGTKVGISTIAIIKLYQILKEQKIDFTTSIEKVNVFNKKEWIQQIKKVYQSGAPVVIALEKKFMKNSSEKHKERIEKIKKNGLRL